jgi:hypothetical protein
VLLLRVYYLEFMWPGIVLLKNHCFTAVLNFVARHCEAKKSLLFGVYMAKHHAAEESPLFGICGQASCC